VFLNIDHPILSCVLCYPHAGYISFAKPVRHKRLERAAKSHGIGRSGSQSGPATSKGPLELIAEALLPLATDLGTCITKPSDNPTSGRSTGSWRPFR